MSKYVTEFIGTFFLVFVIGLTGVNKVEPAPLAIGAILMVMVFMGGHVSGAHYNPAVSLAVWLRGRLKSAELLPYWCVQILGALAAGAMVWVVTGGTVAPRPGTGTDLAQSLLVEALFTFALALVVLNVATAKGTAGNSFYGLAIGFTIAAAAFAGGGISGGAYNPAVGVGLCMVDWVAKRSDILHVWLYIVGPLAGGALAAFVFKVQNPDDQ
jgi:aquaporin Z